MGVFISHAQADKALVDKFVDLLQTGLNISHKDIFCTSLEGLGIPRGETFVSFIREKMAGAKFVIMLITPRYYESAFCLCELGATWLAKEDAFPILVPPLGYENLKAVLHGVQSGPINDKDVLNELRDRLTAAGLASAATGRWEAKRDEFINAFPRIQKKLSGPTVVTATEHETLKRAYEAAQGTIEEKDSKIEKLEDLVAQLKNCKDRTEVAAVIREASGVEEQFNQLVNAFKASSKPIPSAALEAMFYHFREEPWFPRTGFGTQDHWEEINRAAERGFVKVTDGRVDLEESHPKVRKALDNLWGLSQFMAERAGDDFRNQFEEENGYPFTLHNRDFWREQLDL
jgi:hypothetical protein